MAKAATIKNRMARSVTIKNPSICMEEKPEPVFEFQTEFPEFVEREHRGMFTVHFLPETKRNGERRGVTLICFLDLKAKLQFRVPTRTYTSAKRNRALRITSLNSHQLKAYGKLAGVSYAKLRDASSALLDSDAEDAKLRDIDQAIATLRQYGFVYEDAPARKVVALKKERAKIPSSIPELI